MPLVATSSNRDRIISSEVHELINYRPHWIVRWGNLFFFLILALMLAMTWFVRYPDIIKGSMKLEAINAPKLLVVKTEGKLERLLVSNEEEVKKGEPLAFIQSTGSHEQMLELRRWINYIEPFVIKNEMSVLLSAPRPIYNQLGDVQSVYQNFQDGLKETLETISVGYYVQKKQALLKDIDYLSAMESNAEEQQQLLKQDYELQQFEYSANESLAKDKVIAPLELNQNKSKLIGKKQSLQLEDAQLINNKMNFHNKKKELLDLQKYITDQHQKFKSELLNLKSKVEEWTQQYIIVAPEDGKVLFTSFLQVNQLLLAGQEMFYVQPSQSSYYGQLMVSQTGFGKIKIGQRVLIKMESFPSSEYGYITGVIKYISNIPTPKDSFLIEVELPRALMTSYNKTIYFRNNLMAGAEVITDNRRLADRFLGQFKDLIKR